MVTYQCDQCQATVSEHEILRKKIVFVNRSSTNMAVAYMPDNRDYCLACAQKEASPFRRQRGRPKKVG